MIELTLVPIAAFLNRARGCRLFGLTGSTVVGRLVSMGLIALWLACLSPPEIAVPMFAATYAGLMLWATPAWDMYWSAQIGDGPHSKWWGNSRMLLRQLLIVPTFVAQALLTGHTLAWALLALVYWLPYYAFGAIDRTTVIPRSEYTIGALIGITMLLVCYQ